MSDEEGCLRWQLLASHVPATGDGGGMVRYAVEMAAALERRRDVELSVLVAAGSADFFAGVVAPGRVRALPNLPTLGRSVVERFAGAKRWGGPYDVVHGTKHLVPRRSPAIRVLTVHDMLLLDRPRDFGLVKRATLRRPYLASLTDADALICVSEATRTRLIGRIPSRRAFSSVVPLAVSSGLTDAAPQCVPSLAGRVFALAVGDASYRKNLSLLVDSWDEVSKQIPDAVLAMAGPPSWAGADFGGSFDRLRASGRVVVLGRISDQELRWCYERAAVALCPSLVEGFGLPAVEALAFRAPLITSTDAALVEASGDLALHLPGDRPDLWVKAIVAAMAPGREPGPVYSARTWDQVAEETVRTVRRVRQAITAVEAG